MTSMKDRMLAGEQYIADDPAIIADLERAARLGERFNRSSADDPPGRLAALRELLGSLGEDAWVRPPLYCDYGHRTHIGPRTFVNFNAVFLDVARITIGADVQIGPNVQLLTATHPVEPEARRAKWESAQPITISDNVWLGGGVIVLAGVTIGENTVVGAGAVVTRDLPANVVAVGNPARPIRSLTQPS
ncbi:sugar O-acetyltransferase [Micromonospora tulbaghiae]|uniref:Sugar O-acetyltransferase n=1 Tax=Micromonospora tulbaghiae TaxID=479978 RepID=A0AAW4JQD1_9ACTN|nr:MULTISPECIES: sugar O-acetyltransferase [Micromonospora]MBO4141147.1 sugar O-acetyltransferase [Micromonospora tulbaghiae]MCO1617592.1 sugar O-acetyltransferase [Micromonospora sp. CPM1]RLQ08018.1 sugar O-acetyltransferase [Micromonospora sp. BL1]